MEAKATHTAKATRDYAISPGDLLIKQADCLDGEAAQAETRAAELLRLAESRRALANEYRCFAMRAHAAPIQWDLTGSALFEPIAGSAREAFRYAYMSAWGPTTDREHENIEKAEEALWSEFMAGRPCDAKRETAPGWCPRPPRADKGV